MNPTDRIIDPDGEVRIVLRNARLPALKPGNNVEPFNIRVSAKHLVFASPVFKKLLMGNFKEGITLLQNSSVEITAEDWSLGTLMTVLHAIHGQYHLMPEKLSLETMSEVAAITDYYDCKNVLHLIKKTWIKNLSDKMPETYCRSLVVWIWVSWYFQMPSEFKTATSVAMSLSDNRIDSFGLPIPQKAMGKVPITQAEMPLMLTKLQI